jgi:hypothetical protein
MSEFGWTAVRVQDFTQGEQFAGTYAELRLLLNQTTLRTKEKYKMHPSNEWNEKPAPSPLFSRGTLLLHPDSMCRGCSPPGWLKVGLFHIKQMGDHIYSVQRVGWSQWLVRRLHYYHCDVHEELTYLFRSIPVLARNAREAMCMVEHYGCASAHPVIWCCWKSVPDSLTDGRSRAV